MPPPSYRVGRKHAVPLVAGPLQGSSAQPVVVPRSSARMAPLSVGEFWITAKLASVAGKARVIEAMVVASFGAVVVEDGGGWGSARNSTTAVWGSACQIGMSSPFAQSNGLLLRASVTTAPGKVRFVSRTVGPRVSISLASS